MVTLRINVAGSNTSLCLTPPPACCQDFLEALARVVPQNNSAVVNYRRMYVPLALPGAQAPDELLKTIVLMKHVQVGGAGGVSRGTCVHKSCRCTACYN
jgi:hypothetical protein